MRSFKEDYITGDKGVDIFLNRVIGDEPYEFSDKEHKEDFDIKTTYGVTYEIKTTYYDNNIICLEEYYNCNAKLMKKKAGWIVTSGANYLVFVSKKSGTIIIYPFKLLQNWYKKNHKTIKEKYQLKVNRVTEGIHGDEWQGAFRKIPIEDIPIKPIVIK